jgi:hypothetical protein
MLLLLRLVIERRSAGSNVPCGQCSRPIPATAPFCAGCGTAQPAARQGGLFGLPLARPLRDLAAQQFALITVRRCPRCATRLPQRTISQSCPGCTTRTFADAAAVQGYLTRLDRRLPWVVLGCLLCGLVPLFGLIPGLMLYRIGLISALSSYIGDGRGCLVRTAINLLNALLVMLQPLPVIGAVTLPLLCLSNYVVYRGVLRRAAGSGITASSPGAAGQGSGTVVPSVTRSCGETAVGPVIRRPFTKLPLVLPRSSSVHWPAASVRRQCRAET